MPDFTYGTYDDLLHTIRRSGYAALTVREYIRSTSLPPRFVILRHDVDRKPMNALDLARMEADRDLAATYYFRTVEASFHPGIIRGVEALGHEVGYHYEDLDRTKGDVESGRDSFRRHLQRLREHATVDTICMHGNPLTSYDNRNLWDDREFGAHDIVGEAYLSMDFTDVTYLSDTGRTWRDGALKIKDHTVGEDDKDIQVDTTGELIDLLEANRVDRLCLLIHPNRWAGSPTELLVEFAKDHATNAGKYLLQALRGR